MAKVYSRDLPPSASFYDKNAAFKKMLQAFNKAVADAGILHECKKREFYESPGEKRRRKKKQSLQNIMKEKLRENFPKRRVFEEENR